MLHVPINIRSQIPSPTLSPTVEQKDFIPHDNAPIVIESNDYIAQSESPLTMSPPVDLNSLQNNIEVQEINSYQVS